MSTHTGARGAVPGSTVREEALIARLSALAPALDGEPDPEWQARTRARMVAMAAVRTPEPAPVSPLRRVFSRAEDTRSAWRSRLTAGIAGAAAAVTGLASVVALSADAGPGDALYGGKRGTEQTQLALAGDARGRTLLAFATTRLEELGGVLDGGSPVRLVEQTLALMDAQTLDGAAWLTRRAVETGSSAPLDDLSSWSAGQSAALEEILAEVPEGASAEAAESAALLGAVEERVAGLRAVLACAGGPATEGSDDLGPRPGDCASPGGSPVDGGPGAADPDAPTTDGTTAVPTDGSSGSGDGSGTGSDGGDGSDGDPRTGTDGGPLPTDPEVSGTPGLPTPGLPVPTLPTQELPTLLPDPDGSVRLPSGGTVTTTSPSLPLDLDESVEDLTCGLPGLPDC